MYDHRVLFVFISCIEMYVKMCTLCANKYIINIYIYIYIYITIYICYQRYHTSQGILTY